MSIRVALASMCAVTAIGLLVAFATMSSSGAGGLSLALATISGSPTLRVEAPAGVPIEPLQLMMNSKDLPVAHHDDYSLVFN
jgi:hypothetical protein